MAKLLILMASYQGEAFLERQIDSIQRQSFEDWHLLIRNDGEDSVAQALVAALAEHDSRIEWLSESNSERLGACGNFGLLLSLARQRDFPYFALADQDDIWAEDKLQREISMLWEREFLVGSSTPILLHSDLRVVNDRLETIAESFIQFRRLEPLPSLANLLARNSVTGCTCLGNRALLELAVPLPAGVVVHDWWLALCALAGGELLYLAVPTVSYRQHGKNTIGAGFGLDQPLRSVRRARVAFHSGMAQAVALGSRLPESAPAQTTLKSYANLLDLPHWRRYRSYRRMGISRTGLVAHLQFLIQLLVG